MRARRNRASTAATLSAVPAVEAPRLPNRPQGWDWQTESWWRDVWSSPMAAEFDRSDRHGLLALAVLVDDFWRAEGADLRQKLAAEIRLQRQCFGLTPLDRRRLQWEIERADEAEDKGRKRRSATAVKAATDPRRALYA